VGRGSEPTAKASEFARALVETLHALPMVIDADALNAFAGKTELLRGKGRTLVLTPHPGGMARLVGMTVKEVSRRVGNRAKVFDRA